jgi:hypothetical protein
VPVDTIEHLQHTPYAGSNRRWEGEAVNRLAATLRHSRSKVILVIVVALASLVAGVAFAFGGPFSNGPTQDRVYGGGRVPVGSCSDGSTSFCSGVTREYSIFAVSDPQGGGAYGTVTIGNVEFGGPVYSVRVTCLAVSGILAEIGGIVVNSADTTQIGDAFRLFVRDSGSPGAAARDGISPLFIDSAPVKPTCGELSSDAFGNGYFMLAYGDVAVEDR